MKLECVKEKLLNVIYKAEKITDKNLTLPILSSISLEAVPTALIIRATNLDLGFEMKISAKVLEQGTVIVSGNTLLNFLTNLTQEEKITIESVEDDVFISTNKTSTKIKGQKNEDFPIIPKVKEGKKIELNPGDFIKGLKAVWYSASVNSIKPELSSVFIYSNEDGEFVFAATDSFRLAEKRVDVRRGKEIGSVLIPYKNIPEIIRVVEDMRGDISVRISTSQISFSQDETYLVSRIIDGTFPDYKQIIPKEFKTEVVVLKQDFLNTLKLANVFSDTFHQITLKIVPEEKLFEIYTKNADVGESNNSIEATIKGEEITISFNYKYILDCFQSIEADSLSLSFAGLGKPVLIKGVSDKNFLYIVMPMNK